MKRIELTEEELVAIRDALYHQKQRQRRYLHMLYAIDERCAQLLPDYNDGEDNDESNDDSEEV